jgi:hypothetical protein
VCVYSHGLRLCMTSERSVISLFLLSRGSGRSSHPLGSLRNKSDSIRSSERNRPPEISHLVWWCWCEGRASRCCGGVSRAEPVLLVSECAIRGCWADGMRARSRSGVLCSSTPSFTMLSSSELDSAAITIYSDLN